MQNLYTFEGQWFGIKVDFEHRTFLRLLIKLIICTLKFFIISFSLGLSFLIHQLLSSYFVSKLLTLLLILCIRDYVEGDQFGHNLMFIESSHFIDLIFQTLVYSLTIPYFILKLRIFDSGLLKQGVFREILFLPHLFFEYLVCHTQLAISGLKGGILSLIKTRKLWFNSQFVAKSVHFCMVILLFHDDGLFF